MPEDDIVELKIGLAKLEAEWKAHGDSSIDFRRDMKEMLNIIQSEIGDMKEKSLERKADCFKTAKMYTDRVVGMALAIPATILVLLKLLDVLHK